MVKNEKMKNNTQSYKYAYSLGESIAFFACIPRDSEGNYVNFFSFSVFFYPPLCSTHSHCQSQRLSLTVFSFLSFPSRWWAVSSEQSILRDLQGNLVSHWFRISVHPHALMGIAISTALGAKFVKYFQARGQ